MAVYNLQILYNFRALSIPSKSSKSTVFFLDSYFRFRQSNITNEPYKRFEWLPREVLRGGACWPRRDLLPMHDFLIALVFVAMVASPAIVVPSSKPVRNEDR